MVCLFMLCLPSADKCLLFLFSILFFFINTNTTNLSVWHACIYIFMGVCIGVCICTHIWKLEISAESLLSLSTLGFIQESLTEPGWCRLAGLEDLRMLLPTSPGSELQTHAGAPSLCAGGGNQTEVLRSDDKPFPSALPLKKVFF